MNQSLRKSIKKLRGKIKKSDFIFAFRRRIVDKDLKRERRAMAQSTLKSKPQIKEEIRAYRNFWKRIPQDYIRYGLFNKSLSQEEINDYIPMQYYYCEYYESVFADINQSAKSTDFIKNNFPQTFHVLNNLPHSVLNAIQHGKDLSDKLLQYLIMLERGVQAPAVIAVLQNDSLFDLQGQTLDFSMLKDALNRKSRLFVKPTDGCGGAGIMVMTLKEGKIFIDDSPIESLSDIKTDSGRVYIIQEGLEQHTLMQSVNSSSVNTLRVLTKYENSHPKILGIILRMGRAGSQVDNSAVGGISVGINIENGNFYPHGGREHGAGVFESHPDSGFVFKGASVPDWERVLAKINDTISRITEIPLVGWDIALGNDDVYTLEFNMGFGIEHAQTILGGLRRRLELNP